MTVSVEVNYMQTDIYSGSRMARILVELIYIGLVAWFIYVEMMGWLYKEAEIRDAANRENKLEDEEFKPRRRCERYVSYLCFNYETFAKDSAIVKAVKMIIGHFLLIFRWAFYFLKVTYKYVLGDFFIILNVGSITLSLISVAYWI